ncbi:BglG family transcription antiterminator [Loigolactobacillus bifermentans]|uniref:Sorbitol operon transcription regulator n=1 Tax=Loigolactobacillus bifermentans DSM 20003 TaxID=1423726 RepID=A0A0R1H0K0_9LACO|nr:HTH domain-containing protein [Loigolactobacillus bifermentans]KRK40139.1 sorbitol operon transcription regulator [Loigolactobacillus bifermentans DSM 20003]
MDIQNYSLLKYFITNDSLTLMELTTQFQVSKRTMLKYIQSLNLELKGIAEIKENRQRYYLKVIDFKRLTSLQTGFLKQSLDLNDPLKRQAYVILTLIKAQDFIVLDDLADELMISKGTLNRDLADLKQLLHSYQAQVISVPSKGIKLQVKHDFNYALLLKFVSNYYAFDELLTKATLKQTLPADLLSEHTLVLIENNLAILQVLVQSQHRLEEPIMFYQEITDRVQFQSLIQAAATRLGVQLTETEIQFLCYPFNLKINRATKERLTENRLVWLKQLFDNVEIKVKSEIDSRLEFDHVFEQIKYHLLFMLNRVIFHVQTDNLLSNEAVGKYPIALELATATAQGLGKQVQVEIPEAEVNYLVIYFEMEIEEQNSQRLQQKAAIVGQVSRSIKRFIIRQLNDLFQDSIEVVSFATERELIQSNERYLIIFSNRPIQVWNQTTPVVRINSVFRTDEMLCKIQVAQVEEAIAHNWCDFQVTTLDTALGYYAGTERLIETEIDQGRLNQNFLKAWQRREKETNNVFENGIAIPHVIDDSPAATSILLRIGIFKQPVKYQNRPVRFIFLIGIPQKLDQNLNRTLSQLYDLIFMISRQPSLAANLLDYDDTQPLTQITEGI